MREIKVRIEGVSPLLMNRFAEEKAEEVIKRVSGVVVPQDIAVALYILPDGRIYQPASHIEAAFIKAAVEFKITGKGKKTYKDLARSTIFVEPDAIIHEKQSYTIDKRPVVNPTTRGRVIRSRPRLDEWALTFKIRALDNQFPKEVINAILVHAGTYTGIGDFRPRFGRFIVTEFTEIPDDNKKEKEVKSKGKKNK